MARKLFEKQGIRTRAGALATGTVFVVYTDTGGTVEADISATSGGSAIAGSTVTVADLDGLGLATLRFYGPTDGTDTLYLRCPADTSLGVQEIEADEDERLDALEAGGGGSVATHAAAADPHPGYELESAHTLAAHDSLGLATDSELAAHEADTTAIHGIADTSALATTSGVTSAVSTHAGLTDPHGGYVLESLYDAKGDLLPASAADTPARLAVGADGLALVADSAQSAGMKWAVPTPQNPTPDLHGYLAWAYDPVPISTGTVPTAGTVYLVALKLQAAMSVTRVILYVATAGSSLTSGQNFAGLYGAGGVLIGTTADQTTGWGSAGVKAVSLVGGPFSVPAGYCYVGFVANGSTTPAFGRIQTVNAGLYNGSASAALSRFAVTNQTSQTTLPTPITLASNTAHNVNYWAAIN